MVRPLIRRNAIASLDWIGKSAPVPLLHKENNCEAKTIRKDPYDLKGYTHTRLPEGRQDF